MSTDSQVDRKLRLTYPPRVMVTTIDADGMATAKPFAEGWIDENGEYLGRPVDVAQLGDGSILVSDDLAGAIYRIWYEGS